jgi:hypothetical protein
VSMIKPGEKFGPIRIDRTAQHGKIEFTINNVHAVVHAVQVFTKNECKYQNYLTFLLYLYNSYTKIRIQIAF